MSSIQMVELAMKGMFANIRVMTLVFVVILLLALVNAQALPGNPPEIDSMDIYPESPTENDDLTCSVEVSDGDGDLDYVYFRWYVNGGLTKEITRTVYGSEDSKSDTLDSWYTDANDYVVCQVSAYDFEDAYAFDSHAVRVGSIPANSLPTISYVEITPRHPNPQQDLTCSVLATDMDDNLDYVRFEWYRNNKIIRSTTKNMEGSSDLATDTLDSGYTSSGDWIRCLASVYDTYGTRDSEYSLAVVIESEQPYPPYPPYPENRKPVAILMVNNFYAETDEMIYFSGVRSYDLGGYVLQYKFDYGDGEQSAWLPDSTPYSYHSYSEEGTYYAMVRVKDNEYLESEWSNPIVIRVNGYDGYGDDHEPEIEDIDIRRNYYENNIEFECDVEVYDRDSDLDYVKFKWYVDGDLVLTEKDYVSGRSDEAHSELNLMITEDYYTVKCKATVYDEERNSDSEYETVKGYLPYEGEECEISVNRFDYYSYLRKGQEGWVEIEVENTGERSGTLTIDLYVDGSLEDSYETYLRSGRNAEKRFEFPLSLGDHDIRVEAYLPCSERVRRYTEMTVFRVSSEVFIPEEEEEEDEEITETSVTIHPKSLDIEVNSGEILEIIIESTVEANFEISVENLPEDWANYPEEVEVDGREKVYVYIVPKEVGNYEFEVSVKTDGETFEEDIELYVAPESEDDEDVNGITGFIGLTQGNWLIGLGIVFVVVFLTALYFVAGRFKKKTYEDHVYGGSYPPRMTKGNAGNIRYSDGSYYPKYGGELRK